MKSAQAECEGLDTADTVSSRALQLVGVLDSRRVVLTNPISKIHADPL